MPYTMPSFNYSNGSAIEQLLQYESSQINFFGGGLLLLIFFVIAGVGYNNEQQRTGRARITTWFAVSGIITAFISIILYIYSGIVSTTSVIICITASIIFSMIKIFDLD